MLRNQSAPALSVALRGGACGELLGQFFGRMRLGYGSNKILLNGGNLAESTNDAASQWNGAELALGTSFLGGQPAPWLLWCAYNASISIRVDLATAVRATNAWIEHSHQTALLGRVPTKLALSRLRSKSIRLGCKPDDVAAKPITKDSGGPRVKKLQKAVKSGLKKRGFDWLAKAIIVDGKPGPMTFKMAGHLGSMRGLSEAQVKTIRSGRITPQAERVLTGELERTSAMKKREHERAAGWKKFRHEHLHPPMDRDGISEWRGILVPSWLVGEAKGPDGKVVHWLDKIVAAGWGGSIASGVRTAAHSEELCFQICNQPSCSGTCAGRSSNHVVEGPTDWGALDVSEYTVFGRICREIGCPLRNDLPADRVHMSPSGH